MTTNSKEYQRAYYAAHREEIKAYYREYNKKKRLERGRVTNARLFDLREDYRTPTKEDFQAISQRELTYSQKYYAANKERIRAQQKESRRKKKINEYQRAYYAANREHILEMNKRNKEAKKRQEKLSKTFMGRLYLRIFG